MRSTTSSEFANEGSDETTKAVSEAHATSAAETQESDCQGIYEQ